MPTKDVGLHAFRHGPSDRASRRLCAVARTTEAIASRGRAYHVANLQPSGVRDSSGVHGENRPAVNWNKRSNWNRTKCLKCLFPNSWRKRVGVELSALFRKLLNHSAVRFW